MLAHVVFGIGTIQATEITLATWNLKWFPSGVANLRKPEVEPANIQQAGDVISQVSPSLVFLQEIRDTQACVDLATASGSNGLRVAVCSEFKDDAGIPLFQQCAILTTYPVVEASSERWHSFGIADPPRGYAYALLDVDGELVACYAVHLKSNLVRNESDYQMNILKRELAASQLLSTIAKPKRTQDGRLVSKFVIGGDFNTSLDQPRFMSESTIRSLLEAGFENCFAGVDLQERFTLPASGPYEAVTFDYILYKGFSARRKIRVMPSVDLSDHRMIVLRLTP